jgi:polysaccharide biosynthesis protein PslF
MTQWRSPALAVLSTYPPTPCGLATFAAALTNGLSEIGIRDVGVVRAAVDASRSDDMRVVAVLRPGSASSRRAVVRRVNAYECLLLQHEYGIYGGPDGAEILDLIAEVDVPVVTTLHTVPLKPSDSQRSILESIVAGSAAVVTMTETARSRLIVRYNVDPTKVTTIVHGATVPRALDAPLHSPDPTFLTWGLLGPGKGIEWVIDALGELARRGRSARYIVAGRTHPRVLENEGESYREMLMQRAADLGVEDWVEFDPSYRPLGSLLDLIAGATCVVLPYDSDDQITSGVLVDAVSAGRPVIATRFPHAEEILAGGAGLLVPHASPEHLADAMEKVVTDRAMVANMSMAAASMAPSYRWTSVAADYADLAARVANPSPAATPAPVFSQAAAFGVGQ